jgi:ascorbate-specific PTS system EIIC-type component UlaA
MTEHFKLNLGRIWLLVGGISLVLPVFLPSSAHPQNFLQNVIGTTTITMFILSFPSSLFGIPLFFFAQVALGIDPNTIGGMYLNLFLMFVLGMVQWFWIVPRLLKKNRNIETLNLRGQVIHPLLTQEKANIDRDFFDSRSRTPLERAISEDEGE